MGEPKAPETAFDELLTEHELAARWHTTPRHIRRLRVESGLPYIKLGRLVRFDADDVGHWLATHKTASAAS